MYIKSGNVLGLQDQLLSKVVYEERPELEKKFFRLIENVVSDRSKIRDLEDKCLDLLHSSEGNILDDEELISTIDDSKNTANTIQRKVVQSEGLIWHCCCYGLEPFLAYTWFSRHPTRTLNLTKSGMWLKLGLLYIVICFYHKIKKVIIVHLFFFSGIHRHYHFKYTWSILALVYLL